VTRWREDRTRDPGSQFVYLRDVHTGTVWSAAYSPSARSPTAILVEFLTEKAIFERRDGDVETRLEIAVSPRTTSRSGGSRSRTRATGPARSS